MKKRHGDQLKAFAVLLAAAIPSTVLAAEPPAEPFDGSEAQPAEPAAGAPTAAPAAAAEAPPASAEEPTEAPAPAKAPPAPSAPAEPAPPPPAPQVAPPPDQNLSAQDIAALSQLSLEDLLAVPAWKITTASKREESSATAPATVFVVTKEDIYLRGYSNLVDVLKDLPGMEITEYIYAPMGTQVAVRGVVGNNKVIVLVNGMRVNSPGGDPLQLHSDYSVREAEQIEIIYGPGSTLYGQDAISAIINIKTKKTGGEHWIDVGAGAGYPWRYDSWLGLNRKVGDAEINGYIHYNDATLTNREKEFPDEYATYRNSTMYTSVPEGPAILNDPKRWDRGLNAFLQLSSGNFSTQLWHRQSWRSSAEGRAGTAPFLTDNKWSDVATVADAKYLFKLAEHVSLSSTLSFNRYQLLPESTFIVPNTLTWVNDHKYAMETSFHLEETVSAKIGELISLLGGFVYGHYDIMPMGTVPPGLNTSDDISSQAGTINYYTTQGDPSSKVSINKVNNPVYQSVGVYVEGTAKLHDRVRLLVGMRVDKDERYDEIPLSPRAALIVNPLPELALKAIYTQAFVAPPPYNMFNVYQSWWINAPNLELKPEKARSFELNAEFRKDNVMASLSGYYNIQTDLLNPGGFTTDAALVNSVVYTSPDPGAMSMAVYHDANSGEIRTYGCDVFGRYSLLRNRATAWGSYSYVESKAKNISNGEEVTTGLHGLSHHNFRFGATLNIIRDKLFANLSFWLRSNPQNVIYGVSFFGGTQTTLEGASKWPYEANLNLIYRIAAGFEAFATLNNFTNHHFASNYDLTPYPGETFRGIAGLRFRN